ncbi:MAG: cobyrinate a,c-diamide synthase [Candidatus Nitrospinota bacterium M3_3B_026]
MKVFAGSVFQLTASRPIQHDDASHAACPRLVIAGAASGAGKTSVAAGLAAAFRRRGMSVRAFKTGPDFLDPTYLKAASGQTCHNLDGWMMGREHVTRLFAESARGADIAIIEGAMGLFDGLRPENSGGSSAEIARWLGAPVILAADAGGAARSFAAMVKGFAEFEEGVNIAGVIASRVGSTSHAGLIAAALASSGAPELAGAVLKDAPPKLPARRLGLVAANGVADWRETIEKLADAVEGGVSLDKVLRIAESAPAMTAPAAEPAPTTGKTGRVGVALDEAFHFYYPDNLKALEDAGLEIVYFSPLRGRALPPDLDAVYIGGGYPEDNAEQLSANGAMLNDIKNFAGSGMPLYAECGGLMYLSEGVETLNGARFPMTGVLPAWIRMRKRFKALGYVEARLNEDTLWGRAGDLLRGHRFHYSELAEDPAGRKGWKTVYTLTRKRTGETEREGYSKGGTLASYAHLHFASAKGAAERFAEFLMEGKAV